MSLLETCAMEMFVLQSAGFRSRQRASSGLLPAPSRPCVNLPGWSLLKTIGWRAAPVVLSSSGLEVQALE